jgi:hypothetical protein
VAAATVLYLGKVQRRFSSEHVYKTIAVFGEEIVVGSGRGKDVAVAEQERLSERPLYGTSKF